MNTPLYQRLLGDQWLQASESVKNAHASSINGKGTFRIERGHSIISRIVASLLRMPSASDACPTILNVAQQTTTEKWIRSFNGVIFPSIQEETTDGLLLEKAGILIFVFKISISNSCLVYRSERFTIKLGFLTILLPKALSPRIEASERQASDSSIDILVTISAPLIGKLVSYGGTLHFSPVSA